MINYTVQAICAIKRDKTIKAIDVKSEVQSIYVAKTKKNLNKTVWQTGGSKSFYRKGRTGEVVGLSPESVIHFIFSRQRFHLRDYHLLK